MANFDAIVDIQNEIISQVCSGVDEQLGELVSGEEGEWVLPKHGEDRDECSLHRHRDKVAAGHSVETPTKVLDAELSWEREVHCK